MPISARSADVKSSFIKREKADEKRTAAVTAAEIALHAAAAAEAESTENGNSADNLSFRYGGTLMQKDRFITLAIESSCDDTGIALLDGGSRVLANALSSQIDSHSQYGGVVPELASRMHQEAIIPLLNATLSEAGITDPKSEIDLIAVTAGPGLMGSLLVGVMTAKALSQGWQVPLIGVNHLEGHIFASVAANEGLKPPFISVIVSGGHTELVHVRDFGDYTLLGSTRDDAAGEAFDKVAKVLELGYPGGPIIDRLAKHGDPNAYRLPTPLSNTDEIEFSFSGLKTAAATLIGKLRKEEAELPVENICASFQKAVIESLAGKIMLAVKNTNVRRITLSGGVAANSALRTRLSEIAEQEGTELFLPPVSMCTDNAVMIAAAGYSAYGRGIVSGLSLSPDPSWEIW
ncbi:MAG: tRNA (adenosine(37)-N6)-threonylcarbamoyltransferase complex transferase subunit TsaD [Synergistaceae bacterium]